MTSQEMFGHFSVAGSLTYNGSISEFNVTPARGTKWSINRITINAPSAAVSDHPLVSVFRISGATTAVQRNAGSAASIGVYYGDFNPLIGDYIKESMDDMSASGLNLRIDAGATSQQIDYNVFYSYTE